MNLAALHTLFLNSNGISTDTRKIEPNTIFFALKGEHFNGNEYAELALKNGATLAVVDDKKLENKAFFHCEEVLKCLQELANYHRRFLDLPVIAITGSNGKTTTKKLISNVLQQKLNAQATKGNLNNHIGVPLTLLSFNEKTEIGIVEMGANHQSEIAALCKIAEPNFGYITNFGKAHLEGFGGIEGVIKGKSELYKHIIANKGTLFINADDELQVEKTAKAKRFSIGIEAADCQVKLIKTHPKVVVGYQGKEIKSDLFGAYNFKNIAAAIGIGEYFNVTAEDIKKGIESFTTEDNRSQLLQTKNNAILLDAYNANPSSMQVALENFHDLEANNKMLILGDMFEIGEDSLKEHQQVIKLALQLQFDTIILCGSFFEEANQSQTDQVLAFKNFQELANYLQIKTLKNKTILIKGSRGMALERCLANL
jgi:UDP-N-acetylmuramoyl-tripeptide--D-alanyl-D-alanine ligase